MSPYTLRLFMSYEFAYGQHNPEHKNRLDSIIARGSHLWRRIIESEKKL